LQPVTRFAPSPTGRLHLGHAYSALKAHDFARERGGSFLLRIEDIDRSRAQTRFVDAIFEDMLWLGLEWDGELVYQSERLPFYAEALERLKRDGLVYPCFCTRAEIAAEIAASAEAPHSGPDGPLYPGTCRSLTATERQRLLQELPHAWRLDAAKAAASAGPLTWTDRGEEVPAQPGIFGDVVIGRKDAPVSYHLAATVDDAALAITDVVRGRDLLPSTHVHRLLQALLGLSTPAYHHHRLLLDAQGRRLAKRRGAPSLADLRAAGADPAALAAGLRAGQMPAGYSLAGA
jgi:glutamyl-Q tRNA(Asp) synthetase